MRLEAFESRVIFPVISVRVAVIVFFRAKKSVFPTQANKSKRLLSTV